MFRRGKMFGWIFAISHGVLSFISPRVRDSVCASPPSRAQRAFLGSRVVCKAKSGRSLSIAGSLSISPH